MAFFDHCALKNPKSCRDVGVPRAVLLHARLHLRLLRWRAIAASRNNPCGRIFAISPSSLLPASRTRPSFTTTGPCRNLRAAAAAFPRSRPCRTARSWGAALAAYRGGKGRVVERPACSRRRPRVSSSRRGTEGLGH